MAKNGRLYADTTWEAVVTTKNLAEEVFVRAEAKKKVYGNSLSAFWAKHTKLEAEMARVCNTSQQNFEYCKQSVNHSSKHDCYLFGLYHDFFVPLVNVHKPKLVEEARNLITKEYKLKLLDPAPDEPTET